MNRSSAESDERGSVSRRIGAASYRSCVVSVVRRSGRASNDPASNQDSVFKSRTDRCAFASVLSSVTSGAWCAIASQRYVAS